MRLILFLGFPLGKMWKNMEKRPFFRAAMAGLGSIGLRIPTYWYLQRKIVVLGV